MASTKELRRRISSVKNTQQTTKAMKMVSASKLRRAQESITCQRPYAKKIGQLIRLATSTQGEGASKLVFGDESAEKKALVVVVSSDRGLCGGFNSNINKAVQKWLKEKSSEYASVELAFVGRRGRDFFKRRSKWSPDSFFVEMGNRVNFKKAREITSWIVEQYLEGRFNEVKIVYNEFKNAISQEVIIEDFLPLHGSLNEVTENDPSSDEETQGFGNYIIKPSPGEIVEALLKKHFSAQVFRILLESQASEHGSRMSAMDNATRNADDMISRLTLQFNKQRQAGITQELLEIIAGAESQKS